MNHLELIKCNKIAVTWDNGMCIAKIEYGGTIIQYTSMTLEHAVESVMIAYDSRKRHALMAQHQIAITWEHDGMCRAVMSDGKQELTAIRPTLEEAVERVVHIMRGKQ